MGCKVSIWWSGHCSTYQEATTCSTGNLLHLMQVSSASCDCPICKHSYHHMLCHAIACVCWLSMLPCDSSYAPHTSVHVPISRCSWRMAASRPAPGTLPSSTTSHAAGGRRMEDTWSTWRRQQVRRQYSTVQYSTAAVVWRPCSSRKSLQLVACILLVKLPMGMLGKVCGNTAGSGPCLIVLHALATHHASRLEAHRTKKPVMPCESVVKRCSWGTVGPTGRADVHTAPVVNA